MVVIKKKINDIANKKYIEKIKEILKSKNFIFEEKLTGNPDKDFIYMCKSKVFIKSGGYFSQLIAHLVNRNNNLVIDPIN